MDYNRRQWGTLVGAGLLTSAVTALAQPDAKQISPTLPAELAPAWRQAPLRGKGALRFLGMLIYDVRLWAQPEWRAEQYSQTPLVLELEYARDLSGTRIAERSLKEMQGLNRIESEQGQAWLARMKAIFPDVKANDRITGLLVPGEAARFFLNGKPLGEIADGAFAELFFGIWLSPKTSEPELRRALIGTSSQSMLSPLAGNPFG